VPADDKNVATDISSIKIDSASDIEKKNLQKEQAIVTILLASKPILKTIK